MVCLSCPPQTLLSPFLNTLTHLIITPYSRSNDNTKSYNWRTKRGSKVNEMHFPNPKKIF